MVLWFHHVNSLLLWCPLNGLTIIFFSALVLMDLWVVNTFFLAVTSTDCCCIFLFVVWGTYSRLCPG